MTKKETLHILNTREPIVTTRLESTQELVRLPLDVALTSDLVGYGLLHIDNKHFAFYKNKTNSEAVLFTEGRSARYAVYNFETKLWK